MKNLLFPFIFILFIFGCRPAVKTDSGTPSKVQTINSQPKDSAAFDYTPKISEIKSEVSGDFIVRGFSYFVIASNLSEKETQDVMDNTIAKAVSCFHNDYFEKKPDDITTIFLFKDDKTYRYWAKKLYG